jgi:hypothetical protein
MSEWVRARQGRLIVVCFPFSVQKPDVEDSTLQGHARRFSVDAIRSPAPQRGLSALCRNLGIEFLNLYPFFVTRGFEQQFVDKNHLNEEGHRTTARAIVSFLRKGHAGHVRSAQQPRP